MPEWIPPPGDLVLLDPPDLSFEGFRPEAFAVLDRLRRHPHLQQYRQEKEGIRRYLTAPFKRFRDDLVVNWVIPNRLAFETERNVFSRLLKNDFGAGGCHHHLWMAFYRPGRRRLTDVQLSHSIHPDGFETSLFVGDHAADLLRRAKAHVAGAPGLFLALVNPLLKEETTFHYRYGAGEKRVRRSCAAPLDALPDDLSRAEALWLRRSFARDDVLGRGGALVRQALDAVFDLWPVYRFLLAGAQGAGGDR